MKPLSLALWGLGLGLSINVNALAQDAQSGDAKDFSFVNRSVGRVGGGIASAIPLSAPAGVFEINISATCAFSSPALPPAVPHTITVAVLDTAVSDIKDSGHRRYTRTATSRSNVVSIMTGPMVGYFRQDQSSFAVECSGGDPNKGAYAEAIGFGKAIARTSPPTFDPLPGDQNPPLSTPPGMPSVPSSQVP